MLLNVCFKTDLTSVLIVKQSNVKAAELVWTSSQRNIAPNGAVMRTAFVGIHMYQDLHAVKNNAIEFAKATHYDPR